MTKRPRSHHPPVEGDHSDVEAPLEEEQTVEEEALGEELQELPQPGVSLLAVKEALLQDNWTRLEDGSWASKGPLHIIANGQHTHFPPGIVRSTEEAYAMQTGHIS